MFLPDARGAYERALFASGLMMGAMLMLGGAFFAEQVMGLAPCQLCLLQRWPHAAAVALCATALAVAHTRPHAFSALSALAGVAFASGAAIALYHSGIEWGAWIGPATCVGQASGPKGGLPGLVDALKGIRPARCDVAPFRGLGLSPANANLIASSALAGLAGMGAIPAARAMALSGRGLGAKGM